jgi:hypothetical protein
MARSKDSFGAEGLRTQGRIKALTSVASAPLSARMNIHSDGRANYLFIIDSFKSTFFKSLFFK